MKPLIACLAWALPCGAIAATLPPQSEPVGPAMPSSSAAPTHRPLFEVRYVLVGAIPSKRTDALPDIDLGSPAPAIHPVPLDRPGNATLGSRFGHPNVELCRSWGCEPQPHR
ncbi:MAG: hypothetical protein KGN77_05615 [Xanthomonadaceae bacterium]|nr:hypothetical protein [Xanthomonadaceae bacterium]MDE1963406.1 hypothetical protein [Xanthomonadaceae bacterium]